MGTLVQAHVRIPWESLKLAREPGSGVPGSPPSWFQARRTQPGPLLPQGERGEIEILYPPPSPFMPRATPVYQAPSSLCSQGLCPGLATPASPVSDIRLVSSALGTRVGGKPAGGEPRAPPLPLDDWCPLVWLHRKPSPTLDHCLLIFELSGNELREADCLRFLLPSFRTASQAGRRSWTAPGCWLRCTFGGAQQQERTRLLLQPFLTAQLPSPYWHLQQNASWCHTVISCHF